MRSWVWWKAGMGERETGGMWKKSGSGKDPESDGRFKWEKKEC